VEEDGRVRASPDRHPLALDREALAGAPSARADYERSPFRLDDLLDVHGLELASLVDLVGDRRLVPLLVRDEMGSALLAEVGSLAVDEAALGAVHGSTAAQSFRPRTLRPCRRGCRSVAGRPH